MKRGKPIETDAGFPTPANSSFTADATNARPLSPTIPSGKTTMEVIITSTNVTKAPEDGPTTISYTWSSPIWQPSYTFIEGLTGKPAYSGMWPPWRTVGVALSSVSIVSAQSLVLSPSGLTVSTDTVDTNSPPSTSDSTTSPSAIPTPDSTSNILSALPTSSASMPDTTQSEPTLPNTVGDQQSMASMSNQFTTSTSGSSYIVWSISTSFQGAFSVSLTSGELSTITVTDVIASSTVLNTFTVSDASGSIVVISDKNVSTSSIPVSSGSDGALTSTATLEPWQTVTKTSLGTTTKATSTIISSTYSSSTSKTTEHSHATTKSKNTPSESITSINTSSNTTSSKATSTSSSTPQLVPSLHPAAPTSHLRYFLPIALSLGIALLAILFLIYRRKFPENYAKTEKHCPIRRPLNFIKNLPPILALRERRERNRGIKERQQRYMTRRSRTRLWPVTPSMVGPSGTDRSVRDTRQDQDEWLRSDMLEQYGEKDLSEASSPANRASLPGTMVSGDDDRYMSSLKRVGSDASRNAWDKYFEAGAVSRPTSPRSMMTPRASTTVSRLSMPPVRPLSGILQPIFSPIQNADVYRPGQLTGDGPDNTPVEMESTRRMREMVRAQREKILKEEGIESTSSPRVTWHDAEPGESPGDFASKGGN